MISFIKSSFSTGAKAIVVAAGAVGLGSLLHGSFFDETIQILARQVKFCAPPLHLGNKFFFKVTDSFVFLGNRKAQHIFLAGVPEEFMCRYLVQQKILPLLAKNSPRPLQNVLDHFFVRICLASLIFSGAHLGSMQDHTVLFGTGFAFGVAAEMTGSLSVTIVSHMLYSSLCLYTIPID